MDTGKNGYHLRIFHGGLHLTALLLLAYHIVQRPPQQADMLPLAVAVFFMALLTLFPTRLAGQTLFPFHWITLALALLRGPTVAALAAGVGLLLGVYGLPAISRRQPPTTRRSQVSFNLAWHLLAVLTAGLPFSWQPAHTPALPALPAQATFLGLGIGTYLLLQWGRWTLEHQTARLRLTRADTYRLVIVYGVPFPFVWALVLAYPLLGLGSLGLIGGLIATLHVLDWGVGSARLESDLFQREIQLMETVGRTLRETLDLEVLLTTIQHQMTRYLGMENFYVALLDTEEQCLWYPMAVRQGRREHWPRRPLMNRLTDRVILHGQPLWLTGKVEEELERIGLPGSMHPLSAWLGVPLRVEGQTIGCLAVYSTRPDVHFDQRNRQVLEALADQASVAIQNALLYQQAHRRATQLEKLTQAGALLAGTLQPAEVHTRICDAALQLSEADHVMLFQINAAQQMAYLVDSRQIPPSLRQALLSVPLDASPLARHLREKTPVLVPDIDRTAWPRSLCESIRQAGIRSAAFVPLEVSGERLGTLVLWFNHNRLFGQDFLHLIQSFAAQAALAMANAQLYTRTDTALSRRVEQLSILEAIGRELAAAIRSDQVFEMVLHYAAEFTHSEWGALQLWHEEAQALQIHTLWNYPPPLQAGQAAFPLAEEAFRRRQVIHVPAVRQDSRFVDYTDGRAQAHISVPLLHEGQALGVISLESSQPAAYEEHEIQFLQQLANQAAVALINARLYRESQQHLQELLLLFQTGMRLSSTVDLQTVLEILLQSLQAIEPQAQLAAYLWRQGSYRRWAVQPGTQALLPYPERLTLDDLGPLAAALTQTGPLHLSPEDPLHALLNAPAETQITLFPLQVARERLGVVLVTLTQRALSPTTEQMMQAITAQASLALQNAVLFGNVRQMRDRLMAVLNSVGDGVMMIQTDGVIALANAQAGDIAGLPLQQLIGSKLHTLPESVLAPLGFSPATAARLVAKLHSSYAPTTPRETYHFRRAGQERVLQRITAPVMDEQGTVIGWVLVFHDITEQHHLNQARDMIADTLVHDLRSPLSAIISALDLIQGEVGADGPELVLQSLRIARRSASRLTDLVQSLLEISSLEAGKVELKLQLYPELAHLIRDVAEDYLPQATEMGLKLQWEVPDTLPPIRMDSSKITRVLINLIDNALKFTPEGGRIQIQAGLHGSDQVYIRVRDTGPGIPPEFMHSIFERFVQVPGRRGRRRGIGLGLTFSRLVVEAHGGHIQVRNHPQGGAEFSIFLPLSGPESGANS